MKYLLVLITLLSFNAFADVEKSFSINGDTWKIKTQVQYDLITFCKMDNGACLADGIGLRVDWYDAKNNGTSARVFYQKFLDDARQQLIDYYGGVTLPPDAGEFVAFMEYLIQQGTELNAADKTFTITK